jgi:hypothetical protein
MDSADQNKDSGSSRVIRMCSWWFGAHSIPSCLTELGDEIIGRNFAGLSVQDELHVERDRHLIADQDAAGCSRAAFRVWRS